MIQQIYIKMILQITHTYIRGIHDQVQLSRGKRGPKTDGSTIPNTHDGRSQQGKGENAANPRNSGTIYPTLLIEQKACQSLMKYSSLCTHISSG